MWESLRSGRGQPWEHDPGPPRTWAELFARTPNYRQLGLDDGDERFRWHFGPMFYRGRLDGSARVLVIGQEGAQDESLAHRAFVGGTGARLQHLLGWLGITRSYLFLNTFVYPIHGQYNDEFIRRLAQDPDGDIAQHRHELFERAADGLELVISVGRAAREAVETWREMRGGQLPRGVQAVHVRHPGAAAQGDTTVDESFRQAVEDIQLFMRDTPGWLAPDPGSDPRIGEPFRYESAPVPFADLPFGVSWRLGRGGTSSNRRDSQTAIQLFSADGRHNNEGDDVRYRGGADGSDEGYRQDASDRAWEPPRADFAAFDRWPNADWARLLMGGRSGLDWPDFAALGLGAHPSFGFGAALRGRPEHASVLVLTDQHGHDDMLSGRALCGDAGQRLQRWLGAAGLQSRYAIVRVLPVDAPSPDGVSPQAVDDPALVRLHRAIADDMTSAGVVVALGPLAQRLAAQVAGARPVVELAAHGAADWERNWTRGLDAIAALDYKRDTHASDWDRKRGQVARGDLPYGTLRWQCSSGDRVLRADVDGGPSADYVKIVMPAWSRTLPPTAA